MVTQVAFVGIEGSYSMEPVVVDSKADGNFVREMASHMAAVVQRSLARDRWEVEIHPYHPAWIAKTFVVRAWPYQDRVR